MDTMKLTDCFEEILIQDKEYQKRPSYQKVYPDNLKMLAITTLRRLDEMKDNFGNLTSK